MKSAKHRLFKGLILSAALVVGLLIFYSVHTMNAIAVRELLFSSKLSVSESKIQVFGPPRQHLLESIERNHEKARRIADSVYGKPRMDAISALPTVERIKTMAALNSGVGGFGCGTVSAIKEKAAILRDNDSYGCCSDFNEIFIMLAIATNTIAREVSTSLHTFSDVWAPEFGEWIHVDSQFGLMSKSNNTKSGFLSSWGVRQQILRHGRIDFLYLPKEAEKLRVESLIETYYYDRAAWSHVRLVRSSDVVSQSEFLTDIGQKAKLTTYFVAHLFGYLPRFDELNEALR